MPRKSARVICRQLVKGKSNRQAQTLVKRCVVRVVPKCSQDVDYAPKSRITEHLFPMVKREADIAPISARTRYSRERILLRNFDSVSISVLIYCESHASSPLRKRRYHQS